MSRIFKVASWADGDILQPDPVNRELEETVGEMNGNLDRDNIPNGQELTDAKFATESFNTITSVGGLTSGSVTVDSRAAAQRWISLASKTITTGDGRLVVKARYSYYVNTTTTGQEDNGAAIGIRVNGLVVARSGLGGVRADGVSTYAATPVGPGTHTVELVARYMLLNNAFNHVSGGMILRFPRR